MIQTILTYTIVTFALIGLLSNFFFIFFEEANNELNQSQSGDTNPLTNWEQND
jgi:hypothetical protein